jgi:hypothetical protein
MRKLLLLPILALMAGVHGVLHATGLESGLCQLWVLVPGVVGGICCMKDQCKHFLSTLKMRFTR